MDAIFELGSRTDARLSAAYRIVKDHGDRIYIESEIGEGTQVQIDLPKRDRRIAAA